jgi:hypothetical protein
MTKVSIVPRCIESIIVDNMNKESVKALSHTNYKFDDNGECELVMEFYDGIAYDINGTGLVMTYPTAEKVQKHTILQNCIKSYTGIDDGFIYQHDIALRYGKLEWRPDDDNAWDKHYSKEDFNSLANVMITLSGDIYDKVYELKGDYVETANIIRDLAEEFEAWWNENADEDTDYIEALEDFENKALDDLGYNNLTDEDFDEDPEEGDDPDGEPDGDPIDDPIAKCCEAAKKAADEAMKAALAIAGEFAE